MPSRKLLSILVLGALGGVAEPARADQLAWTSLEDGRRAAAVIEQSSVLVSYCSQCPATSVEVWRVESATVAPTTTKGYYQVKVSGRRVLRSKTAFDAGAYREPVEYERIDDELWDEGIDLAYVYVASGGGRRFTPVCRLLALDCDVRTDAITLSPDPPTVRRVTPVTPGVEGSSTQLPSPVLPVRVGGSIREPRKIMNVNPVYPDEAREARVQGVVILEATIGVDGRVKDVKVLRGIPLLDGAAVDAVRQWRYEPTLLEGRPVAVLMTVTVNFHVR